MEHNPDEVAPPAGTTAAQRLNAYVAALKRHHWAHFHSPDAAAVQRGAESLAWLLKEQPFVDPDFEIFNRHAPFSFRRTVAAA